MLRSEDKYFFDLVITQEPDSVFNHWCVRNRKKHLSIEYLVEIDYFW